MRQSCWRRVVAAAALVAISAGAAQVLGARPRSVRALWVWGEADAGLPQWAARRGFESLYFEIPSSRLTATSTRAVIRSAEREGIQVWAMSGRPEWALQPREAKRWARAVVRNPGLSGVVLDVEPYLLDAWDDSRPLVERRYLRMLRKVRKGVGDLPLLTAVPFWFDHDKYRTPEGTLAERAAREVAGLIVMAYRDDAFGSDGIVTLSRGEIEIARRLDKVAWVGLQTADDELDKLTFFEEGPAAMERAISAVEDSFRSDAGFAGIAVHHYRAYREFAAR